MSIDLIVFESPEEELQTVTEEELMDQALYKLGISQISIEDMRYLANVPELIFTETNIADIAFSQIILYSIPHLLPFETKKATDLDLKKISYFVKVTAPERILTIAKPSKRFKTEVKSFEMFVPSGNDMMICGAAFIIARIAYRKKNYRYILPMIKNITYFKDDAQVMKISRNIWEIARSFKLQQDEGTASFHEDRTKIANVNSIKLPPTIGKGSPTETILDLINTFQYEEQYVNFLIKKNKYNAYTVVRLYGEKSEEASEIMEETKRARQNDLLQRKYVKEIWKSGIKSMMLNKVAHEKFKTSYSMLAEKDKKVVHALADKLDKRTAAPGALLLVELNKSIDYNKDVRRAVSKILAYVKLDEIKILKCDKMLPDGICPHNIFIGILYTKQYKSMVEQQEAVLKETVAKYGHEELLGEITCEICGDILEDNKGIEYGIFSRMNHVQAEDYDKLYNTIWENMLMIMTRYIIIEKSYKIRIGKIIDASASIIRTEIGHIRSELLKTRTINPYNFDKIVNVYIYIYIFAVLVQLVFMNEEMRFLPLSAAIYRDIKKGGERKPKKAVVQKSKKAVEQIFKNEETKEAGPGEKAKAEKFKDVNLKKKVRQKIDTGKSKLQEIINTALSFLRILKGADIESSDYLSMDNLKSIFIAAYKWVYSLNYVNMSDTMAKTTWEDVDTPLLKYFTSFGGEKVLGRSKEKILSEIETHTVYDTLVVPTDVLNHTKKELEAFHYLLSQKIYKETIVPLSAAQKEYRKMLAKLQSHDEKIYIENCIKYHNISMKPSRPYRNRKLKIAVSESDRCRCKDRTYQFSKGAKKVEITNKEVIGLLKEGNLQKIRDFQSLTYIGEKCVGCKNQHLFGSSIEYSFWDYFTNACPVGDFHEYTEKNVCLKCGIDRDKLENKNQPYYKKYKKQYEQKIKESLAEMYESLKQLSEKAKPYVLEKLKITITDSHIQPFLKEFSVSYNFFINIGLMKDILYEKIIKGAENPSSTADNAQIRNQNDKIAGYISVFLNIYNIIKYSEYSIHIYEDAAKLLENVNNKGFHKSFPEIGNNIIKNYNKLKLQDTPKNNSTFLLDELAFLILEIKKKLPKSIGKKLAKYLVSQLYECEKKTTEYKIKGLSRENEEAENMTQALDSTEQSDTEQDFADEKEFEDRLQDEIDFDPLAHDKLDMEFGSDLDMDENLLNNIGDR